MSHWQGWGRREDTTRPTNQASAASGPPPARRRTGRTEGPRAPDFRRGGHGVGGWGGGVGSRSLVEEGTGVARLRPASPQLCPAPCRRPSALPRRGSPRSGRGYAGRPWDCGEHEPETSTGPAGKAPASVPRSLDAEAPAPGRPPLREGQGPRPSAPRVRRAVRSRGGCGAPPGLVPRPPGAARRRSQEGGRPRRGRAERGGPGDKISAWRQRPPSAAGPDPSLRGRLAAGPQRRAEAETGR